MTLTRGLDGRRSARQATSRVSDTLSKGIAALSMDDAYMRRRAAMRRRPGQQTLKEGLLDGTRNLGYSMAEVRIPPSSHALDFHAPL